MSTISGIGGSNSELIQMLQQLFRQQTQETNTSTAPPGEPDESRRAAFDADLEEALTAAGLEADQMDEVKSEIQAAISSVMSNQDDSTDRHEAVKQAIDETLAKYDVDTEAFHETMEANRPPGGPGGPMGGGGMMGNYDASGQYQQDGTLLSYLTENSDSSSLSQLLASLLPLVDETA